MLPDLPCYEAVFDPVSFFVGLMVALAFSWWICPGPRVSSGSLDSLDSLDSSDEGLL